MVWPFRSRCKKSLQASGGGKKDLVTTENWASQDCQIVVSEEPGFFCKVAMKAKVNGAPEDVYKLLADPDNARFFRAVKAVTYRKDFTGKWAVQPFNQASLNVATNQGNRFSRFALGLAPNITSLVHRPQASLVTLEQCVQPRVKVPKALNGYMKGISSKILQTIIEDLKEEVERMKSGKPIPKHQLKKLERARIMKKSDLPAIVETVGSLSIIFGALGAPCQEFGPSFKPWSSCAKLGTL